jgi:hypothetical protein
MTQAPDPGGGRLPETRTFRGTGWQTWTAAELHIIGAGNIGQRVAREAVLAGTHVVVYDFDDFATENAGTQSGRPGKRKVDHIVEVAESIAPGWARGVYADIRHVGVGELARASVLINCSDDPALDITLTRISNGLGIPLLRAAIDGSGERELGRVSASHGGAEYSCQLCTYELHDLLRYTPRTPCPGPPALQRPTTRAGGAIGTTVAGLALIQAQRLVTGNDLEQVLDREWIIDLDSGQLLVVQRPRVDGCLSGHVRWSWTSLSRRPAETTFPELFREAAERLGNEGLSLEAYGHPLCRQATCDCGEQQAVAGTRWAPAPRCPACGQAMGWTLATALDRLTPEAMHQLAIHDVPLEMLGFPASGPMFVARAPQKQPWRLVLC